MKSGAIVIHESVKDPFAELWFAEPAGFTALPLDALLPEPGTGAAKGLRAAVAPILDRAGSETARQEFIAQIASGQRLLAALREFGTVHCSVGLHRDDIGGRPRPLLSFLTITWHATAAAPERRPRPAQ
ncbi:hypothetical protein ACQPXT_25750 [Streptomyces sp. CA-100214]